MTMYVPIMRWAGEVLAEIEKGYAIVPSLDATLEHSSEMRLVQPRRRPILVLYVIMAYRILVYGVIHVRLINKNSTVLLMVMVLALCAGTG